MNWMTSAKKRMKRSKRENLGSSIVPKYSLTPTKKFRKASTETEDLSYNSNCVTQETMTTLNIIPTSSIGCPRQSRDG